MRISFQQNPFVKATVFVRQGLLYIKHLCKNLFGKDDYKGVFSLKAKPLGIRAAYRRCITPPLFQGRKKWITSTSQIKDLESQLKKRLLSLRRR